MERAIDKRESIAISNRGRKSKGMTKTAMKKRINQLKRTYKITADDIKAHTQTIREREIELQALEDKRVEYATAEAQMEDDLREMQSKINDTLYQKQKVMDTNAMMNRLLRKYKALSA